MATIACGGVDYCTLFILHKMHLIEDRRFYLSKGNARFVKYFVKLPQEKYAEELKLQFEMLFNKNVRYTEQPETFNEKIQWLKVHDTTPLKTRLADKVLVRDWIKEKIGAKYLIPLVGGPWKTAGEIDFGALPKQFALKANHGSGMNLIVRDKSRLDVHTAREKCDCWLHELYGWRGMEAQYFHIPRRIYAE